MPAEGEEADRVSARPLFQPSGRDLLRYRLLDVA
jgi:hypothetical protein